uniref:Alpha/beta hydrolase n=1 Tax=Nippostrongylus brasiliensis TaxID=27835 RepID=A0A0N4YDT2_NIPBR
LKKKEKERQKRVLLKKNSSSKFSKKYSLKVKLLKTPFRIFHRNSSNSGDYDTSLGPTAAANLRVLPNARLHKIPNAGHACHLNNPQAFEEICMNFFDLVRNYHAL